MTTPKPEYRFDADGSFRISHYNRAAAFASFLPGIAGAWGIPMWVFYVNRAQGVCSFGLRDKDHPIVEFLPANWAYQLVFRQGFQTFMKVRADHAATAYEPFQMAGAADPDALQVMHLRPHEVAFIETHRRLGLAVEARYFTLPQESLAALVRTLRVRNTGDRALTLQMLDGLALVIPHGLDNRSLKDMRYIAQSHVEVTGLADRTPGFRTKASTEDSALVEETKAVNFCFGYADGAPQELLQPIVDPTAVFGPTTDLSHPETFLRADEFRAPVGQLTENQLPSALLFSRFKLAPGEERSFHSFFGHAAGLEDLAAFAARARDNGYVERKRDENRRLTEGLTQGCATVSSHGVFDAYARQNLLDNVLRGGTPVTLSRGRKTVALPLFARKHGDIERDYNYYIIEPTFFSQGEGNYRDVNQNRRHHVFMNPETGALDIVLFFNLIQADGFNPLHVRPVKFLCADGVKLRAFLQIAAGRAGAARLLEQVTRPFELGRLFSFMAEKRVALRIPREEFVQELLQFAEHVEDSGHGSGYWTDHWTYNLDLLESFRGIFPEQFASLLFERDDFVYADSHVFVKPRSEKYVLCKDRPMQLDSLEEDAAKEALIRSRKVRPHAMRARHGKGEVWFTTLAPKLLALAAMKLASLDSHGAGVEMESERPNWYDALNGLPGQFGSSLSETLELKRLVLLLQESLALAPKDFRWALPVELYDLVRGLDRLLAKKTAGGPRRRAFAFWDRASALKETCRQRIRMGFDGARKTLSVREVEGFLDRALAKLEAGIRSARDRKTSLYHTYFRHEVTGFTRGPKAGSYVTIRPTGFRQIPLPLFLEGQVHALRVERNAKAARKLVRAVKQSELFDRTLNMYKVNACLDKEPGSIGRARTFARGWLENESIWLHMEYKFLLETLRAGLHPEFFEDFRHCAVPFLKPETYGRSPAENSSFLVSEAYPDKSIVGRGFMARLSGATAEFIHMWVLMTSGEKPFRVNARGELEAVLSPALPAWLFTTKPQPLALPADGGPSQTHDVPAGAFAFVFLGRTAVIYRQAGSPRDTFGPNAAKIESLHLTYDDGTEADLTGPTIPEPHATALRALKIRAIHAQLG